MHGSGMVLLLAFGCGGAHMALGRRCWYLKGAWWGALLQSQAPEKKKSNTVFLGVSTAWTSNGRS